MSRDSLQQHFGFVVTKAPDTSIGRDYLDALMTSILLNQSASVVFAGDGLAQLQDEKSLATLGSLSELGELALFAVAAGDAMPQVGNSLTPIDEVEARRLLLSCDHVLSF